MLPEMVNSTWDVIIAHFLGVDHVGHRFGPAHAAMAAKLDQLNGVLQEVMNAMDNATLLIVMGDHGMTPGGNHGGASDDETRAALFLYSKDGSVRAPEVVGSAEVQQVDVVPSLALLLGAPVPFGSLGAVIPHVEYGAPCADAGTAAAAACAGRGLLQALRLNAAQVHRYLRTYADAARAFPADALRRNDAAYAAAEAAAGDGNSALAVDLYYSYLRGSVAMCR